MLQPRDLLPAFATEISSDLKSFRDETRSFQGLNTKLIEGHLPDLVERWHTVFKKVGEYNSICRSKEERMVLCQTIEGEWYFKWMIKIPFKLYPDPKLIAHRIQFQQSLQFWYEEEWLYYEASIWYEEYQKLLRRGSKPTPKQLALRSELETWKTVRSFQAAQERIRAIEKQLASYETTQVLENNIDFVHCALSLQPCLPEEIKIAEDSDLHRVVNLFPELQSIADEAERKGAATPSQENRPKQRTVRAA